MRGTYVQHFLETYQKLNADNLELLESIYSTDVHFIDPAHEITGLEKLTHYFLNLYRNISSISFSFDHSSRDEREGYVQWHMSFTHPKLNSGREVTIAGVSFLRFNNEGKVYYHRDYFDIGAMVYEQLPLLGGLIRNIKRRLGT